LVFLRKILHETESFADILYVKTDLML